VSQAAIGFPVSFSNVSIARSRKTGNSINGILVFQPFFAPSHSPIIPLRLTTPSLHVIIIEIILYVNREVEVTTSIGRFIDEYEAASLTKKAYRQTLELFQQFLMGSKPTEETVEEFIHNLQKNGLSAASVNRHLSALRAYFWWMKKKPLRNKGPTSTCSSGDRRYSKNSPATHGRRS